MNSLNNLKNIVDVLSTPPAVLIRLIIFTGMRPLHFVNG